MAKNKANIEVEVNASKAQKEVKKLIDQFEDLTESTDDTSKSVNKVEKSLEGAGGAGGEVTGAFSKLGAGIIVANQALGLMKTAWQATLGAALNFFGSAKQKAQDMRGIFDPLMGQLNLVDNEFDVLKGSIGDAFLIAEVSIKQALVPTMGILQKMVLGQKDDWAVGLASVTSEIMKFSAFLIGPEGLGGAYLDLEKFVHDFWQATKIAWFEGHSWLEKKNLELLEGMPDPNEKVLAGIKKSKAAIAGYGVKVAASVEKVKQFNIKTKAQKETIEVLSKSLYDGADALLALARANAKSNQGFSNLADAAFGKRLNDLIYKYGKLLPDAVKTFKDTLSMEDRVVELQNMQNEIDYIGQLLMRMKPVKGQAFDEMLAKVKGIYAQLGEPLTINFDKASGVQSLEMLRKAFDMLKENVNIGAREMSQNLAIALREAAESVAEKTKSLSEMTKANMEASSSSLVQGFGSMWGSFITGAQDAGAAMKQFANLLMTTVIDSLIAAMQADAARAAIGAASSQASIPIVGPGLATAAAIAMLSFLKGFISSVMGAKEGGFITGGIQRKDSVPIMLQPGEYVMPLDEVKGMQKFAAQMGGGLSPGGGNRSQINISFNSTLPATRTQAKEIMRRDILPLIRSLEAGGY